MVGAPSGMYKLLRKLLISMIPILLLFVVLSCESRSQCSPPAQEAEILPKDLMEMPYNDKKTFSVDMSINECKQGDITYEWSAQYGTFAIPSKAGPEYTAPNKTVTDTLTVTVTILKGTPTVLTKIISIVPPSSPTAPTPPTAIAALPITTAIAALPSPTAVTLPAPSSTAAPALPSPTLHPSDTPIPTHTPTPTNTPTATPLPTNTPMPSPAPTNALHTSSSVDTSPPPPAFTDTPILTETPLPTLNSSSVPIITTECKADVQGDINLSWQYDGKLAQDESFDIKVKPSGTSNSAFTDHTTATTYTLKPWSGWEEKDYDVQIGVVRLDNGTWIDLKRDSLPCLFKWKPAASGGGGGGSSGGGGPPPPPPD